MAIQVPDATIAQHAIEEALSELHPGGASIPTTPIRGNVAGIATTQQVFQIRASAVTIGLDRCGYFEAIEVTARRKHSRGARAFVSCPFHFLHYGGIMMAERIAERPHLSAKNLFHLGL